MAVEDGELPNIVTVKYVRRTMDDGGDFRSHPLLLLAHEEGIGLHDHSSLTVVLPLKLTGRHRTELDHMLQPLEELSERVGFALPAGEWMYEWYFLELLDRDGDVSPLCWVTPELLFHQWPDDRESTLQRIGTMEMLVRPQYASQLHQMDMVAWRNQAGADLTSQREEWREWLTTLWRANEEMWVAEGKLRYEPMDPWCQMLDFDERLLEEPTGGRWRDGEDVPPAPSWLKFASADHPGLYWRMIPLYDRRKLGVIWEAMKKVLYLTSVFNPAAREKQDKALWKRLQERFPIRYARMSRYNYRSRLREQKILDWSRQGRTLDEMANLLLSEGYHPLDEAEAAKVQRAAEDQRALQYYDSARSTVNRVRGKLVHEGVISPREPGRPMKHG